MESNMSYFNLISIGYLPWAYSILFIVSLCINMAFVTFFKHRSNSGRCVADLSATQSMHEAPTPRLGGVALIAGAGALCPISLLINMEVTSLVWYIICVTPLIATGLAEDCGHYIRPRYRFLAAMASGGLAMYAFGIVVDRTEIIPLDAALTFTPLAIAFTLLATTGIVNAFNLIDGINGLAALTALGVSISLSLLAYKIGQPQVAQTALLLAPLLLGFLVLNYPTGRIFLGDMGSYFIGFTLASLAVYIYTLTDLVSPFSMLLIFFLPISDTLLAIWRRARRGMNLAKPDRLHFHHVIMRLLKVKTNLPKRISNPVSTLIVLPMAYVPQFFGVLTWYSDELSFYSLLACLAAFVTAYLLGVGSAKNRKKVYQHSAHKKSPSNVVKFYK